MERALRGAGRKGIVRETERRKGGREAGREGKRKGREGEEGGEGSHAGVMPEMVSRAVTSVS